MRLVFFVVLVFGFFAWDIAANHGLYTQRLADKINDIEASLELP